MQCGRQIQMFQINMLPVLCTLKMWAPCLKTLVRTC